MSQKQPPQEQPHQPGREAEMVPPPDPMPRHPGSGRLRGKSVLISGGDSGIGRAVSILCAREGAQLAILYLDEDEDAARTRELVTAEGGDCLLLRGDVGDPQVCRDAVARTVDRFGGLNVLINHAAEQHHETDVTEIPPERLERTFRTNLFGYVYMVQAARPHLSAGDTIINTCSVTAYRGSGHLLDYAATRGAAVALTRTLSNNLLGEGIRVNGVAPGPVWTPLIPASMPADKVADFGASTPMGRPGQPWEIAPCYLFLACSDASFMSGQVLHPNGGEMIGS